MRTLHDEKFSSPEAIRQGFQEQGFIASRQIATTAYLA